MDKPMGTRVVSTSVNINENPSEHPIGKILDNEKLRKLKVFINEVNDAGKDTDRTSAEDITTWNVDTMILILTIN